MESLTGEWRLTFPRYSREQLFQLVANIEDYPSFIPGCVATRIIRREGMLLHVDNMFGFGLLRSRFTSQTRLEPPHQAVVHSDNGPWRSFQLEWLLEPLNNGTGCTVECRFTADLRSSTLAGLARLALPETERRTIAAFEKRAAQLFSSAP